MENTNEQTHDSITTNIENQQLALFVKVSLPKLLIILSTLLQTFKETLNKI